MSNNSKIPQIIDELIPLWLYTRAEAMFPKMLLIYLSTFFIEKCIPMWDKDTSQMGQNVSFLGHRWDGMFPIICVTFVDRNCLCVFEVSIRVSIIK